MTTMEGALLILVALLAGTLASIAVMRADDRKKPTDPSDHDKPEA